ncbi:MAG: glutathione peroxidase [Bacteroidales bacterium]|nr:glutathione peroxidase [Bacteroidales bacterium]
MQLLKLFFIFLINIEIISSISAQNKNFHDFSAKTIEGEILDFSTFNGKKVLVVNTASKCGYTPQYKELEELYKKYGGEKFTIIGFPANNFLHQEPGTDEEIKEFCTTNYGVTFQMMSKISVKGDDIDPVYKWLTSKEENGVMDTKVKWNFQKYMIDENGNLIDFVRPKESPMSEKITNWINE